MELGKSCRRLTRRRLQTLPDVGRFVTSTDIYKTSALHLCTSRDVFTTCLHMSQLVGVTCKQASGGYILPNHECSRLTGSGVAGSAAVVACLAASASSAFLFLLVVALSLCMPGGNHPIQVVTVLHRTVGWGVGMGGGWRVVAGVSPEQVLFVTQVKTASNDHILTSWLAVGLAFSLEA